MRKEFILKKLQHSIIVSCQAEQGTPFYGYTYLMAKAAQMGGASAIRANGKSDIKKIEKYVNLPIIGIYKKEIPGMGIVITPDFKSAKVIIDAGADIVAIDATFRQGSREEPEDIVRKIKEYNRDILIMADISIFEEGVEAEKAGFDMVATTLSGYTIYSPQRSEPDFKLIKQLVKKLNIPVIAEGRFWTVQQVKKAFKLGAFSVVIGTAITRPHLIVKHFVEATRAQ